MNSILQRLKLIDHLTTKLPIDKDEFVDRFARSVDPGRIGILFSPFEVFSSSKNEYKGTVTFESFKIRRRRRFFDMNVSFAVAEGSFRQEENLLVIESAITGFRGIFIPLFGFLTLFYLALFISVMLSDLQGNMIWFIIPMIFIHGLIMVGVPYYMMRRGVSRMKYELERDLYYMAK